MSGRGEETCDLARKQVEPVGQANDLLSSEMSELGNLGSIGGN
jgi:hypothetical protein